MQINLVADHRSLRGHHSLPLRSLVTIALHDLDTPAAPSDRAFMGLHAAYRAIGGLACADELSPLSEHQRGLDASRLARWRSERRVVGFDWQSRTWWPCFQFALPGPLPLPGVHDVLAVLGAVFDDWAIARWFARPHPALDDRAPALAIADDLPAVLRTARGDRFVARD